jgi:hypothetical protein
MFTKEELEKSGWRNNRFDWTNAKFQGSFKTAEVLDLEIRYRDMKTRESANKLEYIRYNMIPKGEEW